MAGRSFSRWLRLASIGLLVALSIVLVACARPLAPAPVASGEVSLPPTNETRTDSYPSQPANAVATANAIMTRANLPEPAGDAQNQENEVYPADGGMPDVSGDAHEEPGAQIVLPTATLAASPTLAPSATSIPTIASTATPEPTAVPSPTSTPNVPKGVGAFSMATAITERPADVLETVSLFMGGFGLSCSGATEPELRFGTGSYELVPTGPNSYNSEEIWFYMCGWNDASPLQAFLFYEGDQLTFGDTVELGATGDGKFEGGHTVELSENPEAGTYSLLIGDKDESLTIDFDLVWPTEAKMYRLPDGSVMLWNFQPNEYVTLFAYDDLENQIERTGSLIGYHEYRTDENGNLYVEVMEPVDFFGVYGDVTGQVPESFTFSEIVSPIKE